MVFSAKSRNSAGTSSFASNMPPSSDFNRELPHFRNGVFALFARDNHGISTDALPARAPLSCNPGHLTRVFAVADSTQDKSFTLALLFAEPIGESSISRPWWKDPLQTLTSNRPSPSAGPFATFLVTG